MKKIFLLILLAGLLWGCSSTQRTSSVHYPPVPNKPPRIPESPASLVKANLFPHPDQGKEKPRERKTREGHSQDTRDGQGTRQRKDYRVQ